MINEIDMALGAAISAQIAAQRAYGGEVTKLDFAPEGSRQKTYAGLNSKELYEAMSMLQKVTRLIDAASSRQQRLEELA